MSATFNLVLWLTNKTGYQGITASKTVTVLAEAALYFQNIVVSQSCCCGRNIQQNDSTLSPPCNVSAEKLYMQSKNSHINQVPHPFAWPLRPSLIARAAKKVHLHGIVLVGPGMTGVFSMAITPMQYPSFLRMLDQIR
jgi:hypothetical protein